MERNNKEYFFSLRRAYFGCLLFPQKPTQKQNRKSISCFRQLEKDVMNDENTFDPLAIILNEICKYLNTLCLYV